MFVVDKQELNRALQLVATAAAGSRMPAEYSGILFALKEEALTLSATDLEQHISAIVRPSKVELGAQERFLLPRAVAKVVSTMPDGSISFTSKPDSRVTISAGRTVVNLTTMQEPEFPGLGVQNGTVVSIAAGDLDRALRQVLPAVSSDKNRPIVTGVLFQPSSDGSGLQVVATDSYRLTVAALDAGIDTQPVSCVVPRPAIKQVREALEDDTYVDVVLGENAASFAVSSETGVTHIWSRLIEGTYPEYKSIIPNDYRAELSGDVQSFLDALTRMSIFSDQVRPVRLICTEDTVGMTAIDKETGDVIESLDASFQGDPITIGFNPEYLGDALKSVESGKFTMSLISELKPVRVCDGSIDKFFTVLMPLRIPGR